jgi:hypothetical protein
MNGQAFLPRTPPLRMSAAVRAADKGRLLMFMDWASTALNYKVHEITVQNR